MSRDSDKARARELRAAGATYGEIGIIFRIATATARLWCDDEAAQRNRENVRRRYTTNPEYRERVNKRAVEYQRERYSTDPEYRERVNKRAVEYQTRRYHTDPEYRNRQLEYRRNRWQTDPEFRQRQLARSRKRHAENVENAEQLIERFKLLTRPSTNRILFSQLYEHIAPRGIARNHFGCFVRNNHLCPLVNGTGNRLYAQIELRSL